MSLTEVISRRQMRPHPFEGHWAPLSTDPESGFLQCLSATEEAYWHRISAEVSYKVVEGGPLAVSVCEDGETAKGRQLLSGEPALTVREGAARTLSCLGAYVLFEVTSRPPTGPAERDLMPDGWYPKPKQG